PFVVMELLKGSELTKIIQDKSLPLKQLIKIGLSVGSALSEVHRKGFIHRDMKPDNLFIDAELNTKLIDFGFVTDGSPEESESKEAIGTFKYAAPEQSGVLDFKVD